MIAVPDTEIGAHAILSVFEGVPVYFLKPKLPSGRLTESLPAERCHDSNGSFKTLRNSPICVNSWFLCDAWMTAWTTSDDDVLNGTR